MIEYRKGDLFADKHPVIAHGCNAQGVMGSGFAKLIKEKYPEAYRKYSQLWVENQLIPGLAHIVFVNGTYIANLITQPAYGKLGIQYVSYDAVNLSTKELAAFMEENPNLSHVAMPKIGAGLGGGDWNIIESIINTNMKDVKVVVYEL